jgi:AraC-like DNA-binding protein
MSGGAGDGERDGVTRRGGRATVGRGGGTRAGSGGSMCTSAAKRRLEIQEAPPAPRAARRGLKPPGVTFVRTPMPETATLGSLPSVFSPLAKALLDGFSEGVVVFDSEGKVLYANQQAREALAGMDLTDAAPDLQPRLAALGGRLRPLRVGALELGEAMFIPGVEGPTTLAAREKEAIVKTLDAHNWKLAETARHLGISRTTLWRRLKAYGLHRDGRSKWAQVT